MEIFAKPGDSLQQIGGSCPAGWVVMQGERPTPDHVAQEDGAWAISVSVPQSVTMRQARLALLNAGRLAAVDAAIAALPEPDRSAAQIEWEYSQTVQRQNGFVEALAPALGMDAAALDAMFVEAATL